MSRSWEVTVRVEGEEVLTIGVGEIDQWLSGVPDIEGYAAEIRHAAEHLHSFIGTGEPTPCFACGGAGEERWMGPTGEETIPCSVCSPDTFPCPICGGNDDGRQLMCEACGGTGLLGEASPNYAKRLTAGLFKYLAALALPGGKG